MPCAWPRWKARAAWAATTSAAWNPGKRADIALFDLRDVGYSGAGDAVRRSCCARRRGWTRWSWKGACVVEGGELQNRRAGLVLRRHRTLAAKMACNAALVAGEKSAINIVVTDLNPCYILVSQRGGR